MNCKNCNAPINQNQAFCNNCGAPINNAQQQNKPKVAVMSYNPANKVDEDSIGTALVVFWKSSFVPFLGLILYYVYKKDQPKVSKFAISTTIVHTVLFLGVSSLFFFAEDWNVKVIGMVFIGVYSLILFLVGLISKKMTNN